jgi:DNA ligase D-like protein (predicted ligase)
MKEKEWLLERVDEPQVDYLHSFIEPMLSESADKPPGGDDYVYEVKWDGIRAMIAVENGQIKIVNRNQRDITAQFPELLNGEKAFRATCGLFDAEIVSLDKTGKPEFKKVINRLMASGETNIQKLSKSNPVYCYIFDCLYLDGRALVNEPMLKRREWMTDAVRVGETPYRVSEIVEDGESLFEAAREHNLEGIMAKKANGKYLPGRRSDLWIKVKVRNTRECCIIGYTKGKGDRGQTFGALHIAEREGEELHYRGKVGTGFDDATIKEILGAMKEVKQLKKIEVIGTLIDEKISTWLQPELIAEISYSRLTPDKMFREPVFVRLRQDLSLAK